MSKTPAPKIEDVPKVPDGSEPKTVPWRPIPPGKDRQIRLQDLLSGKEPPQNKVVTHFIKKMKDCITQANTLNQEINATEHRLKSLKDRLAQTQGSADTYAEEIAEWDRPLTQ